MQLCNLWQFQHQSDLLPRCAHDLFGYIHREQLIACDRPKSSHVQTLWSRNSSSGNTSDHFLAFQDIAIGMLALTYGLIDNSM